MSNVALLVDLVLVFIVAPFDDARARGSILAAPASKVVLTARTDKKRYASDEAVLLSVDVKNDDAGPVTIWVRGIWPNHRISVRDEDGHEAELTRDGASIMRAFEDRMKGAGKNFPVVIVPGQSYKTINEVDLRKYFKLRKGRYKITVRYTEEQRPTPRDIESNSMSIRIE